MFGIGRKKKLQDLLQQYIDKNYQPLAEMTAAAAAQALKRPDDRIRYDIAPGEAGPAEDRPAEELAQKPMPKAPSKRGFSSFSSAEKSAGRKDALYARHGEELASRPAPQSLNVEAYLAGRDEGFRDMLLRLIDGAGISDPDCYNAARISRQHFSRIKSDPEYRPKKTTAVALGMALKLDRPAMDELLLKAGYALSRSSIFDLIIAFCIEQKIYSVDDVNEMLYDHDQELLGAR